MSPHSKLPCSYLHLGAAKLSVFNNWVERDGRLAGGKGNWPFFDVDGLGQERVLL